MDDLFQLVPPVSVAHTLATSNLKYQFGGQLVFEAISATFSAGICCLIGRNGSGKSTMLRLLAGILLPSAGSVKFNGESVHGDPKVRRSLGYVPHRPGLYPALTIGDNLRFWGRINRLSAEKIDEQIDYLAEWFNVRQLLRKKAANLSRGQQQAVSIVRAFSTSPKVLLLDEPFTGLDVFGQNALFDLLAKRARTGGIIVVSLHDLNDAWKLADTLTILHRAKLISMNKLEFQNETPNFQQASDRFVTVAMKLQEVP